MVLLSSTVSRYSSGTSCKAVAIRISSLILIFSAAAFSAAAFSAAAFSAAAFSAAAFSAAAFSAAAFSAAAFSAAAFSAAAFSAAAFSAAAFSAAAFSVVVFCIAVCVFVEIDAGLLLLLLQAVRLSAIMVRALIFCNGCRDMTFPLFALF
ncbi:hypothetical protein D0T90_07815 [Neisseria animalis]|uniref:Uncharacterized protein n=1 Tax=Neisseria animalis TaxID=492 RepID=A0A5P3MU65_NEIAN|nr:hypothetical protein D0T90_07815 [Neisseria animalis]